VIFLLNLHYCLKIIPKDDTHFYPSPLERWFAWVSLVVFSGLTGIIILAQVFDIPLFGA